MQNLQTNPDLKVSETEVFLQNFQVEELEERLENNGWTNDRPAGQVGNTYVFN